MFWRYIYHRWILFSITGGYTLLLALNSFGIATPLLACPVYAFSGIECFGCGLNRAAIALLQMDLAAAWHHNPLLFLYALVIVLLISYDFYKYSTMLSRQTKI